MSTAGSSLPLTMNTYDCVTNIDQSCTMMQHAHQYTTAQTNHILYLPWITPSGFSIGMILKINLFLSTCALGWLLVRWRRSPLITQLELDSPGCTRHEMTTYFVPSFAASISSAMQVFLRDIINVINMCMCYLTTNPLYSFLNLGSPMIESLG